MSRKRSSTARPDTTSTPGRRRHTGPRPESMPVTFAEVLDIHQVEILRYLSRLCQSRPEAEDLFQETCLRAFRGFDRLSTRTNLRAWLYRIATNVFLNHCRAVRRRREVILPESLALADPRGADGNGAVDRHVLRRALTALPARQRIAFIQRRLHGASYATVGAALGCSAGTARAHVYQACRRLRTALASHRSHA